MAFQRSAFQNLAFQVKRRKSDFEERRYPIKLIKKFSLGIYGSKTIDISEAINLYGSKKEKMSCGILLFGNKSVEHIEDVRIYGNKRKDENYRIDVLKGVRLERSAVNIGGRVDYSILFA